MKKNYTKKKQNGNTLSIRNSSLSLLDFCIDCMVIRLYNIFTMRIKTIIIYYTSAAICGRASRTMERMAASPYCLYAEAFILICSASALVWTAYSVITVYIDNRHVTN